MHYQHHTVLKDLQISGMAARLCLPSNGPLQITFLIAHIGRLRQQQALLDHQTWLPLKDTRSDNFLHSRTKNAIILVLPGPKITPDQKFRDSTPQLDIALLHMVLTWLLAQWTTGEEKFSTCKVGLQGNPDSGVSIFRVFNLHSHTAITIGCAPIARKGERSPFYSTHHSHAQHTLLHC